MSWRERLRKHWQAAEKSNLDPILIVIMTAAMFLLLFRLPDPEGSLIFDETYYVNMARVIMGYPASLPHLDKPMQTGLDPNSEHPPLAKVIMAAGMSIFREDATGWRLPSVMLGLLGIGLAYTIVRSLGGSRPQARLAAFLLAFDNLYFVHSRIATLDIYMVSFALLGTCLYFKGKYEFSGLAFALSTVCKINGLLAVFALFLYEGGRLLFKQPEGAEDWPKTPGLSPLAVMFAFYLAFSWFGLGLLDARFTEFSGPLAHVKHIFAFGTALSREPGFDPQGAESTPLQWWMNDKVFEYLQINVGTNNLINAVVSFKGSLNIYLIASAPFILYFNFLQARRGDRLGLLVVCLFLGNYVPILATWIKARRICYLYYMLPSLPAFALGAANAAGSLPAWVRNVMVVGTLYSFIYLFPFKTWQ